jgi:regulatory protein
MQAPKTYTVDEAQKALEHYCAYQERCHLEVQKKLQSMGMIPIAIGTIINRLIEDNYLNETRFAKAFARGKFKIKKWGKQRITRELKLRDISAYNIKVALQEISEADYN